jgi:hypothetical protein
MVKMARTREENRFNREKKIKRNKKLIESCCWYLNADLENGYYKNNHEVSKAITRGKSKKTNTRKGHSSYRCTQGDYGKAKKYSPHDVRQLQKMNNEDFDND